MAPKPETAQGYVPEDLALVRSACLSLATYLGSFLDDLVVVGGLVPTLLIANDVADEAHVGTKDLDLGLSLAILDENRYVELVAQLRAAGFAPDVASNGRAANHRWKHTQEHIMVDFLIAPADPLPNSGNRNIRVIEHDLSAVATRALPLAFKDRVRVSLIGKTLRGEEATRSLWVCGAGAFLVLKALAFKGRGEPKDAYDLLYVLQNFGGNYLDDLVDSLRPYLSDDSTKEALEILAADFSSSNALGPRRAAAFVNRDNDEEYCADLAGAVGELRNRLQVPP
jgi:hypothetical protein